MRNVYGVWLTRLLAPIVFIELPVVALSAYFAARFIFVQRVLENMAVSVSGIGDVLRFIGSAFVHTHSETQLVLMLGLVVGVYMARDIMRSIRSISLNLQ